MVVCCLSIRNVVCFYRKEQVSLCLATLLLFSIFLLFFFCLLQLLLTCWPLTFVSSGGEVGRFERTASGRSSRQEDRREVRRLDFWPYLHQCCRCHFVFCLSCGLEKRKKSWRCEALCLCLGGETRGGCVFCGWDLLWVVVVLEFWNQSVKVRRRTRNLNSLMQDFLSGENIIKEATKKSLSVCCSLCSSIRGYFF